MQTKEEILLEKTSFKNVSELIEKAKTRYISIGDCLEAMLEYREQIEKLYEGVPRKSIDKVTTTNLHIAFRMVGLDVDVETTDKIIDLVEIIEEKGDDVSITDILKLQEEWRNSIRF